MAINEELLAEYKNMLTSIQSAHDDFVKLAMNAGSQHTHVMEKMHRLVERIKKDFNAEQSEARDKKKA